MSQSIERKPIDLFHFVSMEYENFLVSLANNSVDLHIIQHMQGLFEAALSKRSVQEDHMVLFQLLAFAHYQFLFSCASLMRCHLSEAFASARVGIDSALVGAQIIHDRASQVAYAERTKPFDNFARYLGNLIKDHKPLPHRLVQPLFDLHKKFSTFSSHADVGSFAHRVRFVNEQDGPMLAVEYFQFAENQQERQIHALTIFHTFVMILDVFSDFLVQEQKVVPPMWQDELHGLGGKIERTRAALSVSPSPDISEKV
jgi:hypothetical protein